MVPADDPAPSESKPPVGDELKRVLAGSGWAKYGRFLLAALGSVSWVGGLLASAAVLRLEAVQDKANELLRRWIDEHEAKAKRLSETIAAVVDRVESLGSVASERMQEDGYLDLVRKGFRTWDKADTEQKRELVRRVLTNAAGTKLCSDDVIRLFLDWIDRYHEIHFAIIAAVHGTSGITRAEIWRQISGAEVRDDSAEADLFSLLVRDLSMGGVIRQHRETTAGGQFLSKPKGPRRGGVMKSRFDDNDEYELSELGRQFVHYAMSEVVPRIATQERDG